MNNKEEYLDQLLHSMKQEKSADSGISKAKGKRRESQRHETSEDDSFLNQFNSELDTFDEKKFLADFEQELGRDFLDEEIPDETDDLFYSAATKKDKEKLSDEEENNDDLFEGLGRIIGDQEPKASVIDDTDKSADNLSEEPVEQVMDYPNEEPREQVKDIPSEEHGEEQEDTEEELLVSEDPLEESGELDVESSEAAVANGEEESKGEQEDKLEDPVPEENLDVTQLIDKDPESDEELLEISRLLKANDQDELIEADEMIPEKDSREKAAEEKDELVETDSSDDKDKGNKKKKKEGKKSKKKEKTGGFGAKFFKLLFGEEEIEDVSVPEEEALGSLTQENLDILKELENASAEEVKAKKSKKEDKKKAAKEKKDAKTKAAAEKKKEAAKKKSEKPKKVKPPKVKEPPLPKIPVLLVAVMSISILGLAVLATNFTGETLALESSKTAYGSGDYLEAYTVLAGKSLDKDGDALLNQARLLADLTGKWDSYKLLKDKGNQVLALDCLIQGIGNYNKNLESAKKYGVQDNYDALKNKMVKALKKNFGISEKKALELYSTSRRNLYSYELLQLVP